MLIIRSQAELDHAMARPLDDALKRLLWKRVCQLGSYGFELAHFIVVQPGDSLDAVTEALGFSPLVNFVDGVIWPDPAFSPSWETIEAHTSAYEAVFILSDDGFGWVLLVENGEGQDPQLLKLCAQYA